MAVPADGLPPRVRIHEVGARDGLQNEKQVVPTAVKAEFVHRLAEAGLTTIEATSFVHPKWVPQLADAAELMPLLADLTGPAGPAGPGGPGGHGGRDAAVRLPVLVPNERGLDRALELGVREIAVFGSATESFARANLNRSVDESLAMFEPVVARARAAGATVRGYLSMCFGDPWEGPVPVGQVAAVARRLYAMGCTELSLGDTIGVATPGHVTALLDELTGRPGDPGDPRGPGDPREPGRRPGGSGDPESGTRGPGRSGAIGDGIPVEHLAVHFHDTYGQALSNTLAALQRGVTVVDASAGGLGGCPYAKSATGNLATEDLVWMLNGLGISTGVDLDRLSATSVWMAEQLGRPSPSRTVRALTHREQ
ncbi:hydroxymethylglutaryl-CoA lyase [Streptomyces sp. NBC_01198]|uniref:hydroxymethylglutaryl-CoA lyase n=1 Tax=Streptomyces sp. NBC_01198 TaxID=2903769 RepID=UPI002E0DC049|nr:hydroxymethylglutaryl-CoA lyase [Streptomyces sp. NBC_01198]